MSNLVSAIEPKRSRLLVKGISKLYGAVMNINGYCII